PQPPRTPPRSAPPPSPRRARAAPHPGTAASRARATASCSSAGTRRGGLGAVSRTGKERGGNRALSVPGEQTACACARPGPGSPNARFPLAVWTKAWKWGWRKCGPAVGRLRVGCAPAADRVRGVLVFSDFSVNTNKEFWLSSSVAAAANLPQA
ncbi:hypothetical protein LEMLEM_LOCUS7175, partial [Lemmus lemmus]